MNIAKPDSWKIWQENNQDGYGQGVLQYAERWANLMERRMAEGKALEEIADETSHEADNGITCFMYGCAVQVLADVWVHGEQMRRWHNLATQLQHEGEAANESGGILNPAILNITLPE